MSSGGSELMLLGKQMQLAAGVMLVIYTAAALIILPRELRFLKSAEQPYRNRFIFLDIMLQVCILLVLLPCIVSPQLDQSAMLLILGGFTGLWVVVLALAYLRYIYTYRILVTANLEQLRAAQSALAERARQLEQADSATAATDAEDHA